MCDETRKAYDRRVAAGWFDKYLVGNGIDIGCGPDILKSPYFNFYCVGWDIRDGDAQKMEGVLDASYDFVYSSHCLEHMRDPSEALANWWRILKPGGYLVVVVPDEDLYEQGIWPSKGNGDHKTTWTVYKPERWSWSPVSRNLKDELYKLPGVHPDWPWEQIKWLKQVDTNYDYELAKKGYIDQTGQCIGGVEAAVECVVQKPL